MEIMFICTIFGVFLCISFYLGAKVGQAVIQNKELKVPTLNPVKKIENIKQSKKEKKELDRLSTILENIENYDGSGLNQKEVKED